MIIKNFIPIENVLVRKEVIETRFSCDLNKCKGACCTLESDFGAPLLEEEVNIIENYLPIIKDYLPQKSIKEIEANGFYETMHDELMTRSIENKACVFVYFENEIAKCGIEKAYIENKINFKKPISCHLFPIRVSKFGGDVLRYEKFSECSPAVAKGKKENVKVSDFCEESLTRLYGEKWYSKLKDKTG